ncbi:hypothetical protein BOBR111200_25885 [Bordetella bronchialis]
MTKSRTRPESITELLLLTLLLLSIRAEYDLL